jgi:single-strand DNA-binding protein
MAGDTQITVIGNLTADPELRFAPSGKAVVNFTIASTPRRYDKDRNEWVDGDTLFMRCSMWDKPAENAAESFVKGHQVIAVGNLVQRSYETREGEKRTVVELQVQELGASTRFRVIRSGNPARTPEGRPAQNRQASAPENGDDEPPF